MIRLKSSGQAEEWFKELKKATDDIRKSNQERYGTDEGSLEFLEYQSTQASTE